MRPRKNRMVSSNPSVVVYKPAGVPARMLEWITLTLDEYEVIRLVDYQGQDQETVAVSMGVSRPTVTRIYGSARKKIAQVLVNGQALRIEGGPVLNMNDGGEFSAGRGCGGHGRGNGFGHGRNNRFSDEEQEN